MQAVTAAQMKQIEQNSLAWGLTFERLMENAGSAAAAFIRRTFSVEGLNCMIFCSKGGNGGDGLVVARRLAESGANVVIALLDGTPSNPEAAAMYQLVRLMELPLLDFELEYERISDYLEQTDIIVDAICGTGFTGSLRDRHRKACQCINDAIAAVISLDIPTGIECDSGLADPDAVRADFTVAFDSLKHVHVKDYALEYVGSVELVDIGIPPQARENLQQTAPSNQKDSLPWPFPSEEEPPSVSPPVEQAGDLPAPADTKIFPTTAGKSVSQLRSLDTKQIFDLLPARPAECHKGNFGRLLNLSGCSRYRGAAILSTLGALRCGCGLVELATTGEVCNAAVAHTPEAICLPLPASANGNIDFEASEHLLRESLKKADAIVFGCGIGQGLHADRLLDLVLKEAVGPVVVDADGINALARNIHVLKQASVPVILTPHTGEMARLTGVKADDITLDRQGFASKFAAEQGVTVVLKGAGTLIAQKDGSLTVNHTGNPGLAKGGSGDVLAGMTGALLAQGLGSWQACVCAVHLHGLAADRLAATRSQYGMLPGELPQAVAMLFAEFGR